MIKKRIIFTFSFFIFMFLCSSCQRDKYVQRRTVTKSSQGVYYQIFVRSFADSNADGIGDFKGITQKLDYLSELGVTGIWLMPIFKSPSYHGYDVENYYELNKDYGSMLDFEELISETKKRNIAVILDIMFNHSSVQNKWFVSSQDSESFYRNWYRWETNNNGRVSLQRSIWGHPAWTKFSSDWYYASVFDKSMPDFNLSNDELRDELKKITSYWLKKGVSGFRFDAVSHVYNPVEISASEDSLFLSKDWWNCIENHIKSENNEAFCVGECWEPYEVRSQYIGSVDCLLNFDTGKKIINALRAGRSNKNAFANQMFRVYSSYREHNSRYIDAPFLTNHDQNRVMGYFNNPDTKKQLAQMKCAASLYIFLEGVPFIYYGEELGMRGCKPDEDIRVPFLWDEKGKDPFLTTWYQDSFNKTIKGNDSVESAFLQKKDKNSLLNYYKKIIAIKTTYPSLFAGRLTPFWTGKNELVSWIMSDTVDAKTAYPKDVSGMSSFVLCNVSNKKERVLLPAKVKETISGIDVLFSSDKETVFDGENLNISPYGTIILGEKKG